MAKKDPPKPTLKVKAQLGKASIGKESASLGFKINRDSIDLEQAENFFCGARLQVTIHTDHDPDQKKIEGTEGETLNSVVDVKRFGATTHEISGTLVFAVDEIERHDIADFAQREVLLIAERIGNAAEDVPDEETAAA